MSELAIRAEGLGKQFRIGDTKAPYRTLREALVSAVGIPGRTLRRLAGGHGARSETSRFWALRGVSFEVRAGEVVGVVGRNGAGKSTLLKVLSRITEPTEGWAEIHGRVGSLLEVGTGFHPELTGRENIFLNGAILGMSRHEIRAKLDEIVAFAEVEKFLDTAVKHYSSGMYLRLAFAVAAHLEPEILIVDEVLAVGDAAFQKKCMGKMGDVAKEGRTVFFVSHNMGAISSLTSRCLYLQDGTLRMVGSTEEVVGEYLASAYHRGRVWQADALRDDPMQILRVEASSDDEEGVDVFDADRDVTVAIDYVVNRPVQGAVVAVNVHAADGAHLISLEDTDRNRGLLFDRGVGRYRATLKLPTRWFNSGIYLLRVSCGIGGAEIFDNVEALAIELTKLGEMGTRSQRRGYLVPMLDWETAPLAAAELPLANGEAVDCH